MQQPNSHTGPEGREQPDNFHVKDLEYRRRCSQIGSKIRKEREAQGLSQVKLAGLSGFSSSYLCDIENHRSQPSLVSLMAFAEVLGRPVSYFIGEEEEPEGVKEEKKPFGALAESDRALLAELVREPGFLEIVRAMRGFQRWEKHEKLELISFLETKRKSRP